MSRFLETLLAFGHLLGPGVDEELRKAHKDALTFDPHVERSGTGIAAVTLLWAGREIVKLRDGGPLCICTDATVPACPLHGASPPRSYKPVDPPPQRELTAQVDAELLERAIKAETELSQLRARTSVDLATPAEVRLLQRFMDLAAKVWALFPDDPIRGTPAQSYLERLEAIVEQDLLVPKADRDQAWRLLSRVRTSLGLSEVENHLDKTEEVMGALGALVEDRDNSKTVAASLRETHRELTTRVDLLAKELDTAVGNISLADLVIRGHRNQEKADAAKILMLEGLLKRREEIHTQMSAIVAEQRDAVSAATVQLDEANAMKDALGQKASQLQEVAFQAQEMAKEMLEQCNAVRAELLRLEWLDGVCPECGGQDWGSGEKLHGRRSLEALVAGAPEPCALDLALTRAGLPTQLQRNAERSANRLREAAAMVKQPSPRSDP